MGSRYNLFCEFDPAGPQFRRAVDDSQGNLYEALRDPFSECERVATERMAPRHACGLTIAGMTLCSLAEALAQRPLSYFMRSSQPHAANSITILGERQQLAPLSDALWQAANHSLAEVEVAHLNRAILLNAPSDHWHGLVSRPRDGAVTQPEQPILIAVLGTSPTSGCGAAEDVLQLKRRTDKRNRTVFDADELACESDRGWARLFLDNVKDLLATHRVPAQLDAAIWFKNAVEASYFGQCTERFVHPETRIVLLEVGCSVWGADLVDLLRRLRAHAPRAAIAFVMWGDQRMFHSKLIAAESNAAKRIREAAKQEHADIVDTSSLLVSLYQRATNFTERVSFLGRWYAQGGKDTLHPSPNGHALTAAAAARYLVLQLLGPACSKAIRATRAQEGANRLCSPTLKMAHRPKFGRGSPDSCAPISAPIPAVRQQACYERADRLPYDNRNASNWTLVDEGGVKRVPKLGLVSKTLGAELRLGPLQPLFYGNSSLGCTMIRVDLGYLRSSRPGMGALQLSCDSGCLCNQVYDPYASSLYPYPQVETTATATNLHGEGRNVSVTETTSFMMLHDGVGAPCFVNVRHALARDASARSPSRVRVDSLSMRPLDVFELVLANSRRIWAQHRTAAARFDSKLFYARAARCSRNGSLVTELLTWCDGLMAGTRAVEDHLKVSLLELCALQSSAEGVEDLIREEDESVRKYDRTAVRGHFNTSSGQGQGFCEVTTENDAGQCASSETHKATKQGSWSMPSLRACVKRCTQCQACRFVSFSPINYDCSWFHDCDITRLKTMPGITEAHGWSFTTVAVKGPHRRSIGASRARVRAASHL